MGVVIEKMGGEKGYDGVRGIGGVKEGKGKMNYGGKEVSVMMKGKGWRVNYGEVGEGLKGMGG